jgi:hypothetical protein
VSVEEIVDVLVLSLGKGACLIVSRVDVEHVSKKLSGRGLASFGHPKLREKNIAVRAPNTRYEYRFFGQSQVACGSSGNGSQTSEGLGEIIVGYSIVQLVATKIDLSAYGSDPACVCINDAAPYGDAHREAKLVGSQSTQSAYWLTSADIGSVL